MPETWPKFIEKAAHIAEAIDWVRHKSQDRVRVVVAIGINCVAVAKPRDLEAADAIAILEDVQSQVARAIRELQTRNVTHVALPLEDR